MSDSEDPKDVAKRLRYTPATEGLLKQFLSLESGNYARPDYRKRYDATFAEPIPLKKKLRCKHDGYIAETVAELEFHEDNTHHDADHDFEPVE